MAENQKIPSGPLRLSQTLPWPYVIAALFFGFLSAATRLVNGGEWESWLPLSHFNIHLPSLSALFLSLMLLSLSIGNFLIQAHSKKLRALYLVMSLLAFAMLGDAIREVIIHGSQK